MYITQRRGRDGCGWFPKGIAQKDSEYGKRFFFPAMSNGFDIAGCFCQRFLLFSSFYGVPFYRKMMSEGEAL